MAELAVGVERLGQEGGELQKNRRHYEEFCVGLVSKKAGIK